MPTRRRSAVAADPNTTLTIPADALHQLGWTNATPLDVQCQLAWTDTQDGKVARCLTFVITVASATPATRRPRRKVA